jgi:hypothetical protein
MEDIENLSTLPDIPSNYIPSSSTPTLLSKASKYFSFQGPNLSDQTQRTPSCSLTASNSTLSAHGFAIENKNTVEHQSQKIKSKKVKHANFYHILSMGK